MNRQRLYKYHMKYSSIWQTICFRFLVFLFSERVHSKYQPLTKIKKLPAIQIDSQNMRKNLSRTYPKLLIHRTLRISDSFLIVLCFYFLSENGAFTYAR